MRLAYEQSRRYGSWMPRFAWPIKLACNDRHCSVLSTQPIWGGNAHNTQHQHVKRKMFARESNCSNYDSRCVTVYQCRANHSFQNNLHACSGRLKQGSSFRVAGGIFEGSAQPHSKQLVSPDYRHQSCDVRYLFLYNKTLFIFYTIKYRFDHKTVYNNTWQHF